MAFQLKDFTSIVASMINHIRGTTILLTDFNVGSVNRTLIEAPAVEIDELYQQMFYGLKESIPTAIYLAFDFTKLAASIAYTDVTFTASSAPVGGPVVIPIDTIIRVPGGAISYKTLVEVSIPVGLTTVSVRVNADVAGSAGNTLANTITSMDVAVATVSVSNPDAVISGSNEETEAERKLRFIEFIETISRAPKASVEFGARTAFLSDINGNITEKVIKSNVYEPYVLDNNQPLGYVECYIFNGVNSASAELVIEAQKIIDGYIDTGNKRVMGWKAAGVVCTVSAVTTVNQDVTVTLTAETGFDITNDLVAPVDTAIRGYLVALDVGEDIIESELVKVIQNVPGVYDSNMTVPAGNVTILFNEKVLPATMSIS